MEPDALADAVVEGIVARGYVVLPSALPGTLVSALRERARMLDAQGAFAPAHTGRDAAVRAAHQRPRGDRIAWLGETARSPAEASVLALVDALRVACNRALYLGLAEHELHYAIYPPGAGYVRHRDRFRDDDARVLSLVLYLNEGWNRDDGGQLRLHVEDAPVDVQPDGGTLVAFLSESIEHEVLPARRERWSLTGWLRRRVRLG